MRLWKAWIVTTKDFSVFRKNKYIFYSIIAMPLMFGLAFPLAMLMFLPADVPANAVTMILNMLNMYFAIIAAILPTVIASYSFVGEKVEKSLEPLLATPTTDGELLFGKSLAAFLPCMAATYLGAAGYVGVVNSWSSMNLGVFLLPNLNLLIIVGLMAPLACILSVEANIIVSSRVSDVRAAQQLGALIVLPIILVLVFGTTFEFISADLLALILSGVMAIAVVALFYLSKATFRREEILTRWK
jgi:ABC-2 type transport system permease protein